LKAKKTGQLNYCPDSIKLSQSEENFGKAFFQSNFSEL